MIAFQTSIAIERPIEEVFAHVSDPGNFPSWNSAVREVRTSAGANGTGSTYAMDRQLPTGATTDRLEIVARKQPREFAIRTTSGPTPFLYRYHFAAENEKTILHLDAQVELKGVAALVPPLARLAVKHGVDDNLARLKLILEKREGCQNSDSALNRGFDTLHDLINLARRPLLLADAERLFDVVEVVVDETVGERASRMQPDCVRAGRPGGDVVEVGA